jgi:hypothetical protein
MDPRKIGAWVARALVTAGLAAGIFFGTTGVANAADSAQAASSVVAESTDGMAVTYSDPEWG